MGVSAWALWCLFTAAPSFELSQSGAGSPRVRDFASFGEKRFSAESGLPDNSVQAITADNLGRLIVGTQDGLAIFNGMVWRARPPRTALRSTFIRRLLFDRSNALWVGTFGAGLLQVQGEAEALFDTTTGLPSNEITTLHEDSLGRLWVGTSLGASLRNGAAFEALADTQGVRVDAICASEDAMWVAAGKVVHRYDLATARHLARVDLDDEIRSCVSAHGKLWLGGEKKLWRRSGDELVSYKPLDGRASQFSAFASGELKGVETLWVGTQNGEVIQITAQGLQIEQVAKSTVLSLHFSKIGPPLLWVGSQEGLVRKNLFGWKSFRNGPDLLRERARGIAADKSGNLWVGTEKGLAKLSDERWEWYQGNRELGDSHVFSVSPDRDGSLFIGTRKGALIEIEPGKGFRSLSLPVADYQSIQKVYRKSDGAIAVGTRNGMYEVRPNGIKTISSLNSTLGQGMVYDFAERLQRGRVLEFWIATDSVLHRSVDGDLARFGADKGLPNDNVNALLSVAAGDTTTALWIATNGGGALRLGFDADGGGIASSTVFDTHSTLPIANNIINSMVSDSSGRVYLCTNKGVTRLTLGEQAQAQTFTKVDGLFDDESLIGAAFIDSKQRVWVGTAAGLSFLDPADDFVDTDRRALFFDHVLVNEREADDIEKRRLGEDRIRFDFALLDYFKGDQTEFRSQLVGAEEQPSAWSNEASRAFTALRHGSYSFNVWARDYLGREVGPITKTFVVAPPLWLTWWAYTLYAGALAGSMLGVVRLRLRQLRKRAEELELEVQKRTVEIRQQKEEIEAQKADLEESHKQADRIFNALKQAMPGRIINDRYQIGELVGEGGFGAVYRGQDVRSSGSFAIKIFKPQAGNDSPEALERFKGEAKNAARVEHPNAVKIFDYGVSEDGVAFIVMDLLLGTSVEHLLKKNKTVELRRALGIVHDSSDVLALAHELGIIHRDVKPDNIFLHKPTPADVELVKVLDFGVAKAMKGDVAKRSITMTGAVVGTPTYMAPERLQDENYDGRSDVYSLGIILYEMLCGRPPFESRAENVFSVVMAHLTQAPPLMTDFDKTIPKGVQQAVMAGLEKNPANRPNAKEYRDLMRKLMQAL